MRGFANGPRPGPSHTPRANKPPFAEASFEDGELPLALLSQPGVEVWVDRHIRLPALFVARDDDDSAEAVAGDLAEAAGSAGAGDGTPSTAASTAAGEEARIEAWIETSEKKCFPGRFNFAEWTSLIDPTEDPINRRCADDLVRFLYCELFAEDKIGGTQHQRDWIVQVMLTGRVDKEASWVQELAVYEGARRVFSVEGTALPAEEE